MKDQTKYLKVSFWLNGGGKIVEEIDIDEDGEEILKDYISHIKAVSYSTKFVRINDLVVRFADVSAIRIEEKIDPATC